MPIFLIIGPVLFEIGGGPKGLPLTRHPVEMSVTRQPLIANMPAIDWY